VTRVDDIWEIMGDYKSGDVVRVQLQRAGKLVETEVELQDPQ
jgi:S1-C subfamily serine protease